MSCFDHPLVFLHFDRHLNHRLILHLNSHHPGHLIHLNYYHHLLQAYHLQPVLDHQTRLHPAFPAELVLMVLLVESVPLVLKVLQVQSAPQEFLVPPAELVPLAESVLPVESVLPAHIPMPLHHRHTSSPVQPRLHFQAGNIHHSYKSPFS